MQMRRSHADRYRFLEKWAWGIRGVVARALKVQLGVRILPRMEPVNGPRVAGLRIGVGKDADRLVSLLTKNDMATLRQSVPNEVDCPDCVNIRADPLTDWYGRMYCIYLPWSDRLAEKDVQTQMLLKDDSLTKLKESGDSWCAGLEETYQTIFLSLDIRKGSPHYFFLGSTTSGKSWAIQNAIAQLALHEKNRFIFIDVAKKCDGLGIIPALRGTVGPPALDLEHARAALAWALDEMEARYSGGSREYRIIVVIDELPSLSEDNFCVKAVESLASAGAQCRMHLFLAAQHAVEKALGPFAGILKANVGGRMVFNAASVPGSVEGLYDSRALNLQIPGDCYALNANLIPIRLQASYVPQSVLRQKWIFSAPLMDRWPDTNRVELPDGNGLGSFSESQIAEAVKIRLIGRLRGEQRGYGRTVVQAKLGIGQNQSVRLCQAADTIVDALWKVK